MLAVAADSHSDSHPPSMIAELILHFQLHFYSHSFFFAHRQLLRLDHLLWTIPSVYLPICAIPRSTCRATWRDVVTCCCCCLSEDCHVVILILILILVVDRLLFGNCGIAESLRWNLPCP